tara:strand:+ start:71 stop:172 length:102 start_codon:yes stop_codon:yes gene_type:complete
MIPSHANYHTAHMATHDNDYVEWHGDYVKLEEE